jgi:predicted metal-dependent peptidase
MELSDQQVQAMTKRLLLSRLRLLTTNGFFGLLLMHARFGLDEDCDTAYTDGRAIRFSPKFLTELTDRELDFVMMHEVMHMALRHCSRGHHLEHKRFNIACDIVVNSNILLSANMDKNSITLSKYGVSMHLAPDGKEGYHYTAEQVYEMLPSMPNKAGGKSKGSDGSWDDHDKWVDAPEDDFEGQQWDHLLETACEVISIRESSQSYGGGPMMAQRLMKLGRKSEIDWRTILQEFLQEEINDYSFSPPDRRFRTATFSCRITTRKRKFPVRFGF